MFAPAALAAALADAIRAHGSDLRLKLERCRHVSAASFAFRADVFSRNIAREIRTLVVDSLPAGARLDQFSEHEKSHPEARGPEPFAPLHSFEYHVSGRIIGAFDAVIDVWKHAREREAVEIESLVIHGNSHE